jgi:hypothetical protein
MTFQEYCINYCEERGMLHNQAKVVFDNLMQDKSLDAMNNRWNDQIEDYPKAILAIIIMNLRKQAAHWIEANLPKAFYKPLFEEES